MPPQHLVALVLVGEHGLAQVRAHLDAVCCFGCRAVILTGGGDPLLYPHIEWLVDEIRSRGLEIGLITNGTACNLLPGEYWSEFAWVRVSWTGADTNIPRDFIKGTLGFSVVNPDQETLRKAEFGAIVAEAEYLRVVPDCRPGRAALNADPSWSKTFLQAKEPRCPNVDVCYQAFLRPYLHESGVVYPCDSVTLHDDRQVFDPKYALCDLKQLTEVLESRPFPFKPRDMCSRCVFADTVEMLEAAEHVKHPNFI
jgi:MoaA/NifB/PqqE/SkfB family radical SAM enzyme